MDVALRPPTHDDIPDLSRLHLLATHGLTDAIYHDALPGLSTNEIYERVLARTGTVRSYSLRWTENRFCYSIRPVCPNGSSQSVVSNLDRITQRRAVIFPKPWCLGGGSLLAAEKTACTSFTT
jgi:hypothetical protein